MPKNADLFYCNCCDVKCYKQSNYTTHLLTSKHIKRYKMIQKDTNMIQKMPSKKYTCECGKDFTYHSGLWRHKKKCHITNDTYNEAQEYEGLDDKALILKLLVQNTEIVKSLVEVSKEKGINQNNVNQNNQTHTNSHNKTFNLQFFLNETCKDAMNIGDFVSSIKPQLTDLETTGRLGYVEGISNIILNNLKNITPLDI